MAKEIYHGDDMDVTISTSDGTSITVGVIQSVTIVPGVETDELYGADSILREDIVQRNFSVNVEAGLGAWDVSLLQEWLGGSGSTSTGMVDTSDPALFTVTGKVTPRGGSATDDATVTGVVFPEMPIFDGSTEEYITKDLSGVGKDISISF